MAFDRAYLKVGIFSGEDRDGNRQTRWPLGSLKRESAVPQGRSQGQMYCRSCEEVLSILNMAPKKYEHRSDLSLHQQPTDKSVNHDICRTLGQLIQTKIKMKVRNRTILTMSMVQVKVTESEYVRCDCCRSVDVIPSGKGL